MASVPPPREDLHVLIIGAGITGLALAHGLQQAGIRFSIFEKESIDHQSLQDWTLAVHWSIPMIKKLLPPDLFARLSEAYAHPCCPDLKIMETLTLYDGRNGEVMKDITSPGMVRLDRNRMRKLCKTGISVQYNKLLDSLTYGADGNSVTAHFQDGTTAVGDLLIGADGARSIVREQLLGEERAKLSPSSSIMMLMNVDFRDAKKALHARAGNPIAKVAMHPTGSFIMIALQNVLDESDPTTWTFVLGGSWEGNVEDYPDSETRLAAFREAAAPFCEPYRSVASWVPDGTHINIGAINYWATIPWDNHNGRVTLMGDAAHPMTPMRGQGLNNCMADALNFVDAIAQLSDKRGLPELVANYEAEMIPRGRSQVEESVTNFEMLHDFDKIMQTNLVKKGLARDVALAV